MDHSNTAELVSRCRASDPLAVEELVEAYRMLVYRLALSILDDPAEADEATQDTFVAAIHHLDSFRGDSAFTTWLYAIALNTCRGRLRKRRVREKLALTLRERFSMESDEKMHAEQVVVDREVSEALWRAIRSLDAKLREVVVLRYYHQLRLVDVAHVVGVTERTVRARLYAAYEKMRDMLREKVEVG